MSDHALTSRQAQILRFIRSYIEKNGVPPTIREIGVAFNIAPASVFDHLQALERKGKIQRRTRRSRSTKVLGAGIDPAATVVSVPILGRIAAGRPIFAEENLEGYLTIDGTRLPGGTVYALRVSGDSMTGAGILDGDFVIARYQESADDSDIVVALIEDKATVKRLRRRAGGWRLEAENPAYKTVPLRGDNIRIQGKVILVHRILR